MKSTEKELNQYFRRLLASDRKASAAILSAEAARPGSMLEKRVCPVCGGAGSSDSLSNGSFTYVRCSGCSLLYMNPCLSDALVEKGFTEDDPENKEYWSLIGRTAGLEEARPRPDPRKHRILRDILPIKPGGRLLDIGCANGDFLMDASHFFRAEGLEINSRTAENARARGLTVHTDPIENMPGRELYDVITMNQLLYGAKYPLSLIREASRLLKPGGILYVNTPNSDSLAMRIYRGSHCHVAWKADLNVFNRGALAAAAGRCSLELRTFYTEWTNLYLADLAVYAALRGKFVHRRNGFLPFYRVLCSLEESLQTRLTGNRFGSLGDYCVCTLAKVA